MKADVRFRCLFGLLAALLGGGCNTGGDSQNGASIMGGDLMSRLGGLWSGEASQTPLGSFPIMTMDLRAADSRTLFSRTDLDSQNSLRFAFLVETYGGRDVLVFRNGGYFQGILRDTRAELMDVVNDHYRFCAVDGGCDYLQATWEMQSDTQLTLDVQVRGAPHLSWPAQRVEARTLPQPFPADFTSQGSGQAPFPPLPSLTVEVTWSSALAADADVWVILSQNGCSIDGCTPSRQLMATAPAGSSSVMMTFEQIHSGDYQAMALLDRQRTFATTLHPNPGDGITWPLNQDLSAPPSGSGQASLHIALNVP